MAFVVIDFETANPRFSSICQAGIVGFDDDAEIFAENILIDPEDEFHPVYSSIHGILPADVAGKPNFKTSIQTITALLGQRIVVSHSAFDRTAYNRACVLNDIAAPVDRWLDSLRVARRAWPDLPSHGLASLATHFGMPFRHHDAVEDARTTGLILLRACRESGTAVEGWFDQLGGAYRHQRIKYEATGDGVLSGEVCVFTGALSMPRSEVAKIAAAAGAIVEPNVTARTTLVIVGEQDLHHLAGKEKSSKHLKAEALIRGGQRFRILQEPDFAAMLG